MARTKITIRPDNETLAIIQQVAKDQGLPLSKATLFIVREYARLAAAEWRDLNDPVRAQAWADYWDAHYESTCPPVY